MIFIWLQHLLFKHEKKSLYDIETLCFHTCFNFILLDFWCPKTRVKRKCFIFFVEQSHHDALHIWSSNICQMSISWNINQFHVCLVISNQPKCPNLWQFILSVPYQKFDNINLLFCGVIPIVKVLMLIQINNESRVTWTPNYGIRVTRDLLACYLDTKRASKEE